MAWTTPRTWVSGETVTHTIMNTHVRDNLNALGTWTTYTPTLTGFTVSSTTRARYVEAGKWISVQYRAVLNAAPSGTMTVSLPFTIAGSYVTGAGGDVHGESLGYDTSGAVYHFGAVISSSTTAIQFQNNTGAGTWNATVPWTWASGDILSFNITYERN